MIAVVTVLGGFALAMIAMLFMEVWVSRRAWVMYEQWVKDHEFDHDTEIDLAWNIIASANRRRKRIEKILKRERREHMKVTLAMSRHINEMSKEFEQLQDKYSHLSAEVVDGLLVEQEKEKMVKKLTRKVKKKESP